MSIQYTVLGFKPTTFRTFVKTVKAIFINLADYIPTFGHIETNLSITHH